MNNDYTMIMAGSAEGLDMHQCMLNQATAKVNNLRAPGGTDNNGTCFQSFHILCLDIFCQCML